MNFFLGNRIIMRMDYRVFEVTHSAILIENVLKLRRVLGRRISNSTPSLRTEYQHHWVLGDSF